MRILRGRSATAIVIGVIIGMVAIVGATLIYGAVSGEPAIVDATFAIPTFIPFINFRAGFSFVFDFKKGTFDFNFHSGVSVGVESGLSISGGIIKDYENVGDLKGMSVSTGGSYYGGLGISPPIEEGSPWSIMLSAGFGWSAYVAVEKYI